MLDQRIAEGKQSQILLSGVQISLDKVLQRRHRHQIPTLAERYSLSMPFISTCDLTIYRFLSLIRPDLMSPRQPEDIPLRIRTPPPLEIYKAAWPEELPWVQFNRRFPGIRTKITLGLLMLTRVIAFVPSQSHRIDQPSVDIDNLEPVISRLVGLIIDDEVVHEARTRSVLGMSDYLDVIRPELYQGDNTTTADLLWTGSRESATIELFKLMVYLISNNMEEELESLTGYSLSGPLKLLDGLGLLTRRNVQILARSFGETNETLVRNLLNDSVTMNYIEVLNWLLAESTNVNSYNIRAYYELYQSYTLTTEGTSLLGLYRVGSYSNLTLLQLATSYGSIDCCSALLDAGADPNLTFNSRNPPPLELAIQVKSHDTATSLVKLLISKGANLIESLTTKIRPNLLLLAVARGNTTIVSWLLHNDATIELETFIVAAQWEDATMISFLCAESEKSLDAGRATLTVPNMLSLKTFRSVIDSGLQHRFLMSIKRGSPNPWQDIVGFAFKHDRSYGKPHGDKDEDKDEELNVLGKMHALLRHGGNREIIMTRSPSQKPSPLQLAILKEYPRVVQLLLKAGADVNWPHRSPNANQTSPPNTLTKTFEEAELTPTSFDTAERWSTVSNQPTRLGKSLDQATPLSLALQIGNVDIAKILLLHQPKLFGDELAKAAEIGDLELITMLFEAGAIVQGNEALHALRPRDPLVIDLFLRKGATDGVSILEASLIIGNPQMISSALEDVAYDSNGLYEAVCIALRTNDTSLIERLLTHKPAAPRDELEVAALAIAVINLNSRLIRLLSTSKFLPGTWSVCLYFQEMRSYAKQNSNGVYEIEPQRSYTRNVISTYRPLQRDVHLLEFAVEFEAQYPEVQVVNTFIDLGVSIENLNLGHIIGHLDSSKLEDFIELGANVNGLPKAQDERHRSPIFVATGCDKPDLVKILIQEHAKVNDEHVCYQGYWSSLQFASVKGNLNIINQLMEAGADINAPPFYRYGVTCLQAAVAKGYIGIVRVLLHQGAKVNASKARIRGRTAIEAAAEHGRQDIMKLLLLHLRDIDESQQHRIQYVRAVRFATHEGHFAIAKMLKGHIRWNDEDQDLYDQVDIYEVEVVDEMTQELSELEQQHFSQHPLLKPMDNNVDIDDVWESESDTQLENDEFGLENEEVLDSICSDQGTTSFENPEVAETRNLGDLTTEVEVSEHILEDTFFGVEDEDMMRDLQDEGFLV